MLKSSRKHDIIRIISNQKISSQEELLDLLRDHGHELTQATLSRNLKELGIGRKPDSEKGYVYFVSEQHSQPKAIGSHINISPETILSIEYSYNFGILRTIPGFASSVAMLIDSYRLSEIAGTIAGDDTILIIPREPYKRADIDARLREVFLSLPQSTQGD